MYAHGAVIHIYEYLCRRWYHGNISRIEAEAALRLHPSGSYLVRNCESARKDYSLSLKWVSHFQSAFHNLLKYQETNQCIGYRNNLSL